MTENKTFLIIDLSNLFFRARYITGADQWTKIGLSLHVIFNSIKQAAKKHNADHVVFATEGHSWRKTFDEDYKRNRAVAKAKLTESQREEDELFFAAFNDFTTFIKDKTNATVLYHPDLEADDHIASWIQLHPDDKHIVISGDTDFHQLLADNVTLYDGVNKRTYTLAGVTDDKGKAVIDKKSKKPLVINPEYALFKKIVRGDSSDNVFSAYPGVRETKILSAFQDREKKGYDWNNFMMSRWVTHDGLEVSVKDRVEHNRILIDLTAQPEIIREYMEQTILTAYQENKHVKSIGFSFLKFCGRYELVTLAGQSKEIVEILSKCLLT
jgi:5'-3' exonuclease